MKKIIFFLFIMMIGYNIHSYSQSFNYTQYYNQAMQKAQSIGYEIGKNLQSSSQFAMRSTNKDIYVLCLNGNKMAYFSDEWSCKAQINSIKTRMESAMESLYNGLPAEIKRQIGNQWRNDIKTAINGFNFTYRKESNPNYRPSTIITNNNEYNTNDLQRIDYVMTQKEQPDAYALSRLDNTGQILGSPFDVENQRTKISVMDQSENKEVVDNKMPSTISDAYNRYSRESRGIYIDDTNGLPSVNYRPSGIVAPESRLSIDENTISSNNENYKQTKDREEWLKKVDSMSSKTLAAQEKNYKKLADMAGLAEYSYKEKQGLPEGWKPVDDSNLSNIIANANKNDVGFHCELLIDTITKKYVLSFRGTEPTDINDWVDDITGNFIKSVQTKKAINITKELLDTNIDPKDIQLTGHSLGGRLAAEASIKTGLIAYTFNAADISWKTRNEIGINNKGNILNTVSSTDLLTNSPGGLGKSGGGINHQSAKKLVSNFSLFPIINPPTVNDYMAGYTNVINETAGIHHISSLRKAIEQRHNDIVYKIKSSQLNHSTD